MLLTNQGTSRTILSNYQVAMQTMSYTRLGCIGQIAMVSGADFR